VRLGLVTWLVLSSALVRAEEAPAILREIGFDQRLGGQIPLDASFTDEDGKAVRLRSYFGKKPVVLSLNYYECPMLCTLSLNGLASALSVVSLQGGRDFEVVTISFNPKEGPDLAAAKKKVCLQRYKRPGAEWHFLTGSRASIDAVTSSVGFRYAWDAETQQFAHPSGVLVLTPEGRISRYLYGVEFAPKDLTLALMESSRERIGSAVDRVVLYCYRYDPVRGRYGVVIMSFVRLGGVLTVLALSGFILLMWRREREGRALRGN